MRGHGWRVVGHRVSDWLYDLDDIARARLGLSREVPATSTIWRLLIRLDADQLSTPRPVARAARSVPPWGMSSVDPIEENRSIAKIATFDCQHAVFGHGHAISSGTVERFRAYALAK